MIIETNRLILREWKPEDAQAVYEGLNNINVAKFLTVPFPYKLEDAKDFIEKHRFNDDKNFYFAIVLKSENRVIGSTSLELKENGKNKGGIWLCESEKGKGFGTEVWRARAKFAFEILGLTELENGFFEYNEVSKNMQIKVGYEIIGETENNCPAMGGKQKEIVTRLSKERFYKAESNKPELKIKYIK